MEGTLSPTPVAWVGLCPQCDRVVSAALIQPFESRGGKDLADLQRRLGEWTEAGMRVQKVYSLPTLDGCVKGCTWKPDYPFDTDDDDEVLA